MSSEKNIKIVKNSFLTKLNSKFIESQYVRYLEQDETLPVSWKNYFTELGDEKETIIKENKTDKDNLKKQVLKYLDIFKDHPYIFNLGHGVLPETNPKMMEYLVKTVKDY